jgi:RHS repeat-associated protein
VTYLHQNHLGTTAASTDADGEILQRAEHYPYGEVRYQSAVLEDYSWTGQERDQRIGLSYHSARYFDTWSGRWTAPDPLFLASPEKCLESPGESNLFSYSGNNPAVFVDPNGLCPGCDPAAFLADASATLRDTAYAAAGAGVDAGQLALDVAGVADPTGIADGMNASIHLARGNYADAAISGAGLVPLIGDVAKGPRFATKVSKVLSALGVSDEAIAGIRKLGARLNGFISAKLGRKASTAGSDADNVADGVRLGKQLASEQQVGEVLAGGVGDPIAGAGGRVPLRDSPRLSAEYGGSPGDWQKIRSSNYKASDGTSFETHAYRNADTGQVVEAKTKFQ